MPKERKPKLFDLKAYLKNVLRRASYRHSARSEALKKARVERNTYTCASCLKLFPNKEVSVDHKNPVVPITGFSNWDDYIIRLFCEPEFLQVLCDECHSVKSKNENTARRLWKKEHQ
jgi:5-methylcytosine-specific restriction endonuclease McrA